MAEAEYGVFYRDEDYVGVFRRIFIDIIDITVAGGISLILTLMIAAATNDVEKAVPMSFVAWIIVWAAYFVGLKRSRFRTLGYVVAGARIVDLTGHRPARFPLFLRSRSGQLPS
jgi:hypothetical protein